MRRKQEKSILNKVIITSICVVLSIYVLSMLFPLAWGLLTSLKDPVDFGMLGQNVLGLPNLDESVLWNSREAFFKLANYKVVFEKFDLVLDFSHKTFYSAGREVYHEAQGGVFGIFLNTILYTTIGSVVTTVCTALTAYVTAKFDFKFSNFLYTVLLVVMIIPIVGAQSSTINVLQSLGLYDTWIGYAIQHCTCTGMYYFVFYGFYKSLPDSYAEAAEIDGASNWNIFTSIIIPLSIKQLGTVWLVQFVALWNDYQVPLMYLPTKPTLAYTVWYLTIGSSRLGDAPIKVAAAMTLALPILIMFIFLKNRLMGNVSMGGLKE